MKHLYSLLCEKVIKDAESYNVSFINLFEKLTVNLEQKDSQANSVLFIPYAHELVVCWHIDTPSEDTIHMELQLNIVDPAKQKIGSMPIAFEASTKGKNLRVNIKLEGVPVTTSGDYIMQVQQKEGDDCTLLAEVPFEVVIHRSTKE